MPDYDSNVTQTFDFTRIERLPDAQELVAYLQRQFELGSGKAGYLLSILFGDGLVVGSPEVLAWLIARAPEQMRYLEEAFPLLQAEAMNGDGEAMHFIAHYYQSGLPPLKGPSHKMFKLWVGKAIAAGFGNPQGQY